MAAHIFALRVAPPRLHPASVLAGLAAGAGPAASRCSFPRPTGCMASRGIKGEGFARDPHPFPALRFGLGFRSRP